MAYPEEVLKKAREIFNTRKEDFRLSNEKKRMEIFSKIPQAASLEREIASTGFRLSKLILEGRNIEEGLAEIRRFNEEKKKELGDLLVLNGFLRDSLEPKYICPLCCDTGIKDGKACTCIEKIRRKLMYERLGSFDETNYPTFEELKLSYYGDYSPLMEKTLNKCRLYADNFTTDSKSLLFFGGVGLGKTHVSKAIGKIVIDKGFDVFYIPFTTLSQTLENAKFRRNDESYENYINPILDCELLILDDVGAEFTSAFTVSLLYEIVNSRLISDKPTIISTNLNDEMLSERYGERTASRLVCSYDVMLFKGSDIRRKKKFNLE